MLFQLTHSIILIIFSYEGCCNIMGLVLLVIYPSCWILGLLFLLPVAYYIWALTSIKYDVSVYYNLTKFDNGAWDSSHSGRTTLFSHKGKSIKDILSLFHCLISTFCPSYDLIVSIKSTSVIYTGYFTIPYTNVLCDTVLWTF